MRSVQPFFNKIFSKTRDMAGLAPLLLLAALATLPVVMATSDCQCVDGWTMVDGICTKHFAAADSGTKFEKARSACARNNALLAVPKSESNKNELLSTANDENIWVGVTRSNNRLRNFRDYFGRKPAYINWKSGEPNDNWGDEDCVELEAGTAVYRDLDCDSNRGFICIACPPNYERVNDVCKGCQAGWTKYRRQCLKFFTDDNTLATSISKCAEEGATLFTPHDQRDNAKLHSMAEGRIIWIGFTDSANEGVWQTIDTENPQNMTYSKWSDYEPNNGGWWEEDCAAQRPSSEWNDIRCSANLPRVCVKEQENMIHLYE